MENKVIKEKLIELVKLENNRAIPFSILANKFMHQNNFHDKKVVFKMIDELVTSKTLRTLDSGKIVLGYINGTIFTHIEYQGIISINGRGDGYIKQIDENNLHAIKEFFVFSSNLNGALNGDLVTFHPMDKYNPNGIQNAVVKEVNTRNKNKFVATYLKKGNGHELKIDDSKNYYQVSLKDTTGLVDGQKVLIEITDYKKDGTAQAKVINIIGHINDIDSDILSIVYDNGIEPEFSPEVLEWTKNIKIDEAFNKVRKDITDRDYITIDPATSKDLDDAIYVKKINDNKYFLSVSIADVSSYVPFNSILDNAAIARGTSVYLADRVIPMLPHIISNDWCSLNPCEKKYTLTADMEIDMQGNISKIEVFPSIMMSKKRFSYDEVNAYFMNQTKLDNVDSKIYQQLDEANELHHILRKKMYANGYLDFNIKEPIIILDENNKVKEIQVKAHGEAQMMVEDFMVCANSAVTIKADELDLPFIYRTHNRPSLEKLERLEIEAKKLGFFVDKKDFEDITSKKISKWLEVNNQFASSELINKLILRSMEKATYETHNIHHFGLALKQYTHFTSPIRRYSDLIVHRIYWMYVFTPNLYTNEQRLALKQKLNEICEQCNSLEIRAVKTEREVNSMKFAEYMETKIGQQFDGIISTITSFGIFVELNDTSIEGLVRLKNLGGDFYEYNEKNYTIVGRKTQKIFSFGQPVKVIVTGVDKLNKQIDFEIVGYQPTKPQNIPFDKKIRAKNNNIKPLR